MIRATISEVKDGMSAYLRRVKAGETVLVTERRTPIARIVPVGLDAEGGKEADSVDEDAKLARLERAASWCAAVREAPRRTGTAFALGGRGSGSPPRRTLGRIAGRRPLNFWDTSALVALGVAEPHRRTALCILEADDRMAVWWGAPVEYVAALSRRERDGSLTTTEVSEQLARLRALSQVWYEVQPGRRIRIMAQRLLRVHPLRAAEPPARGRVGRRGRRSFERRLRLFRRAVEPGRVA